MPTEVRHEIAVPASIANMGPGLDALALAVNLYVRLRVRRIDQDRPNELKFNFTDATLVGDNLIERAFRTLAADVDFPSLEVDVESGIPMRAGIGSSAAAIAAGFRLFESIFGPQPMPKLLAAGCGLEGHPENVAAALLGGLVVCCQKDDGTILVVPAKWPRALRLIVATPELQMETKKSRAVLPDMVPMASAVANVQRVALLLAGLHAADYGVISEALRDRLHQPCRSALYPALARQLSLNHPGLIGVCLSGSGPSVAAIADRNFPDIAGILIRTFQDVGITAKVRILDVHQPSEMVEPYPTYESEACTLTMRPSGSYRL